MKRIFKKKVRFGSSGKRKKTDSLEDTNIVTNISKEECFGHEVQE
jgi:hypothetical protein